jgi:hypothetical protein
MEQIVQHQKVRQSLTKEPAIPLRSRMVLRQRHPMSPHVQIEITVFTTLFFFFFFFFVISFDEKKLEDVRALFFFFVFKQLFVSFTSLSRRYQPCSDHERNEGSSRHSNTFPYRCSSHRALKEIEKMFII